jgi:hypothetical protein
MRYRESLLNVQAGFLGPWGDWHHSHLGEDEGVPTASVTNALLAALCEAVPEEVSIAVRRPRFIRQVDPNRVDLNRLAFHNDGLLASDSDLGTYDDPNFTRVEELAFMANRHLPVANGGEMPMLSSLTEPSIALSTFEQLQLTYLNRNYNQAVLDDWGTQVHQNVNFLTLIEQRLGYRWSIREVRLARRFRINQKVTISVTLMNSGFAAIAFPVSAELVVTLPDGTQAVYPVPAINLQSLRPQSTLILTTSFSVPSSPEAFRVGIRFKHDGVLQSQTSNLTIRLANQTLDNLNGLTDFARYTLNNDRYELENPK